MSNCQKRFSTTKKTKTPLVCSGNFVHQMYTSYFFQGIQGNTISHIIPISTLQTQLTEITLFAQDDPVKFKDEQEFEPRSNTAPKTILCYIVNVSWNYIWYCPTPASQTPGSFKKNCIYKGELVGRWLPFLCLLSLPCKWKLISSLAGLTSGFTAH